MLRMFPLKFEHGRSAGWQMADGAKSDTRAEINERKQAVLVNRNLFCPQCPAKLHFFLNFLNSRCTICYSALLKHREYPFETMSKASKKKKAAATRAKPSLAEEKKEENERSPKRLRRSSRNTQQLILPPVTSLAYRRFDELFFQSHSDLESISYRKWTLERVHCDPNIYVIDNFLTPNELSYFQRRIAEGGFQKSFVDQLSSKTADSTLFDDSHRTSTFLSFTKQHDATIASLERRTADFMGCSNAALEALQLVRYLPGQFFGIHHDLGDYDEETGEVTLPRKSCVCPRRLATIFCYLSANPEDGATHFPAAGDLRVQPKPGRAVLFSNALSSGEPDPRTLHAGEAPTESVKYGVNIWITEEYC